MIAYYKNYIYFYLNSLKTDNSKDSEEEDLRSEDDEWIVSDEDDEEYDEDYDEEDDVNESVARPTTRSVSRDKSLLQQLVEMGFPDAISRKSLVHGGSLDGALAWLTEHQDDADIDQPYMEEEYETKSSEDPCVICLMKSKNTVALPCKHMMCCAGCALQTKQHANGRDVKCPVCRQTVEKFLTVFT